MRSIAHARCPSRASRCAAAVATLDRVLDRVAAEYAETARCRPSSGSGATRSADLRRDLGIWVRRLTDEQGLAADVLRIQLWSARRRTRSAKPRTDPVTVDGRFILHGSVDLIERHRDLDVLRITDHKTGKNRSNRDLIVDGGKACCSRCCTAPRSSRDWARRWCRAGLFYCTTVGRLCRARHPDQRLHARPGPPGACDRRSRR